MRICFFISSSLTSGGGAQNWIVGVSRNLVKHHEVNIVGLKYAEMRRLSFSERVSSLGKVNYQEFSYIKFPRGVALPNPFYIGHLLSLLNSNDVVYVVIPSSPVEALFYLLKECFKCRIIAGFHGFLRSDILLQRLYMPLFEEFLDAFDAYHVLNRETYTWLRKMGFNNIYYIPNGVNTRVFQLCNNPSNSQFFNVLFTGRLTEDKGTETLMEIIQYVNEKLRIKDIKFTITGSGPLEDKVKAVAQKYRNIDYLGFVDTKILPKIYANANLFLIPSKTEGMPLRLLEAQSCGLPAIGSKIPGISDVIVNGKTGYLVNVGDVKGFVKAIRKYYELWRESPKEYYNMNKAIREHIVRNYEWSVTINRLESMFKKCASI